MNMEQIYAEHGQTVFKFLMCLCRDTELARDLTQDTFCKAIQSVHRFDGSCKVSTWLCQIAKHLWYQELDRRARRKTIPIEAMNDLPDVYSLEETVFLKLDKLELFKKIHMLGEVEKEVVLFRLTGEFSFREIGEILGKSENWARVIFYRAKQKLLDSEVEME